MKWTEKDMEILKKKIPNNGSDIPELLEQGFSKDSIKEKIKKLGIKKDGN